MVINIFQSRRAVVEKEPIVRRCSE